jgi:hypothetical protein
MPLQGANFFPDIHKPLERVPLQEHRGADEVAVKQKEMNRVDELFAYEKEFQQTDFDLPDCGPRTDSCLLLTIREFFSPPGREWIGDGAQARGDLCLRPIPRFLNELENSPPRKWRRRTRPR